MEAAVDFIIQRQDQTNWCWAAGSVSVATYFGMLDLSQCDLVNNQLAQTTCCRFGNSPACDRPWYPDRSLSAVRCYAGFRRGPLDMATLFTELVAGRPVGIGIHWRQGGGHFVIAIGADTSAGTMVIADPWEARTWRASYGMVCHAYDGTDGVWRAVYLCRGGIGPPISGMPLRGSFRGSVIPSLQGRMMQPNVPIFTAGLVDAVNGSALASARRTGTLRLTDEGVEISSLRGDVGTQPNPEMQRALGELEGESTGRDLRIFKMPALYVTAAWLAGGDREIVVPIGRVPGFLEQNHRYRADEFDQTLRQAAAERLQYADEEALVLQDLESQQLAVSPIALRYSDLTVPPEWSRGPYELVAATSRSSANWKLLLDREPMAVREAFERLSTYPATPIEPARQFPVRGKRYGRLWQYEVSAQAVIQYRIEPDVVVLTV